PEYVSGHSTFSAAAAAVLNDYFGSTVAFTTTSLGLPGAQRSFTSFDQAAQEAGRSRIYAGIHFEFSNQDGQSSGRAIAQEVLGKFAVSDDVLPPAVVVTSPAAQLATKINPTLNGLALDNLSGVAALEVAVDGGPFTSIPFADTGRFSFQPTFALDG